MKKKCNIMLIAIILANISIACSDRSGATPTPGNPYPGPLELPSQKVITLQSLSIPLDAPQPNPGKASISGALYSYTVSQGLAGTIFYLTPAVGNDNRTMPDFLIGPDEAKGDIRGLTDANARFSVNNIPPGNYFLIVWAPYNWIPAENSIDDASPRLIELTENEKKSLGIVHLPWP